MEFLHKIFESGKTIETVTAAIDAVHEHRAKAKAEHAALCEAMPGISLDGTDADWDRADERREKVGRDIRRFDFAIERLSEELRAVEKEEAQAANDAIHAKGVKLANHGEQVYKTVADDFGPRLVDCIVKAGLIEQAIHQANRLLAAAGDSRRIESPGARVAAGRPYVSLKTAKLPNPTGAPNHFWPCAHRTEITLQNKARAELGSLGIDLDFEADDELEVAAVAAE